MSLRHRRTRHGIIRQRLRDRLQRQRQRAREFLGLLQANGYREIMNPDQQRAWDAALEGLRE